MDRFPTIINSNRRTLPIVGGSSLPGSYDARRRWKSLSSSSPLEVAGLFSASPLPVEHLKAVRVIITAAIPTATVSCLCGNRRRALTNTVTPVVRKLKMRRSRGLCCAATLLHLIGHGGRRLRKSTSRGHGAPGRACLVLCQSLTGLGSVMEQCLAMARKLTQPMDSRLRTQPPPR